MLFRKKYSYQHGGDVYHETLKRYNFKPEKGIVMDNGHGGYMWKKIKSECWQEPKE